MSSIKSTILAELEKLRIEHYKADQYSSTCPKHPDSLCYWDDDCNCEADDHNARLEKLIALIKESL
jgi:hypothetical protein